ncbi:MAG TPA: ABC transporter permease [Longimicrobiales bacterium]|nr:ABC transporter permease [Longimicrobiales bacterium]
MHHLLPGTLLEDLRSQKLRLALTLFGIFWGTFAVVVLLAFGTGLERKAEEEMATGTGVVTLRSGMTRIAYRGLPEQRRIRLRPEDAQLLRSEVPGIARLSEATTASGTLRAGDRSVQATTYAVEPEYATLLELQPADGGRFVNRRDIVERRRVAVIGPGIATQLFNDVDPLGRQFRMRASTFTVVGVLARREGSGGFRNDERVFIPATTYRIVSGTAFISSIVYEPVSDDVGAQTMQHAFDLLGARHRFDPTDRRALQQWDASEFEQEIRFFLLALKIFLAVVGGFTLLVGGIGVANIMFVVVRERRVEIGVKRAIGARRIDIIIQFMSEAALLVGLGALFGFLFAVLVVKLTGMIPATEDMGVPVISGGVAAITAGVLALVALAAGVFPARHAARLDPATCLRG